MGLNVYGGQGLVGFWAGHQAEVPPFAVEVEQALLAHDAAEEAAIVEFLLCDAAGRKKFLFVVGV